MFALIAWQRACANRILTEKLAKSFYYRNLYQNTS